MRLNIIAFLAALFGDQLACQIEFLRCENRILRQRIPNQRIIPTPRERYELLKFGKPLGGNLENIISIVRYDSFRRWLRLEKDPDYQFLPRKKRGRNRKAPELRKLVGRMAEKNAWGLTRILGELQATGIKLACTVTAASHIVTKFYKHGPPFTGDMKQFMLRKSLAREAATALRSSIVLLSPGASHFEMAELLWWELCDKEVKQSFAQFEDYVEAAMVLSPPAPFAVTHVLVSHHHLAYLLTKKRSTALIHVLGACGW